MERWCRAVCRCSSLFLVFPSPKSCWQINFKEAGREMGHLSFLDWCELCICLQNESRWSLCNFREERRVPFLLLPLLRRVVRKLKAYFMPLWFRSQIEKTAGEWVEFWLLVNRIKMWTGLLTPGSAVQVPGAPVRWAASAPFPSVGSPPSHGPSSLGLARLILSSCPRLLRMCMADRGSASLVVAPGTSGPGCPVAVTRWG